MSGITLLSLFNISHFRSTVCSAAMAKKASTIRRRSRSKIKTYDESRCEDAIGRVVFNLHQALRGPRMDIKILGNLLHWTIDQGNLRKTSWDMMQQVVPHREEPLLDGDVQSVRYGGMLRDRSGQLDNSNSQEVADSENFVMGSDAVEFPNNVKDQLRKRQKRMRLRRRTFNNLGMFLAATMNAATFMGKNFLDNQKFHHEFNGSHLEENVRHISEIGGRTRRNLQFG